MTIAAELTSIQPINQLTNQPASQPADLPTYLPTYLLFVRPSIHPSIHPPTYSTGLTTRVPFPAGAMMVYFFSSPPRPDRFWGPPRLLSNGYRERFSAVVKRPGREADHLHEMRRLRMRGAVPSLPNTSSWRGV